MDQKINAELINLKSVRLLISFLLLLTVSASSDFAQNSSLSTEALTSSSILNLEKDAKENSNKWNEKSIRYSIYLFSLAAENWEKLNNFENSADCLREISQLYITLGEINNSKNTLLKVVKLDKKHQNLNKKIKTLSLLAMTSLRQGNTNEAKKFANESIKLSEKTDSDDSKATAFYTKAFINYENGEYNLVTQYYEKALNFWVKSQNLEGQTKTLLELAYSFMTNDQLEIGLETAEKSFSIAKELNNLQYLTLSQNAIAVIKSKLGKKQESLRIFLKLEKEFPDGVNSLEKGDMYNHLAGIYYDFYDLDSAYYYKLKAYEIYKKDNNLYAQLSMIPRLGVITFLLGKEIEALEYFTFGFKLAHQLKSNYYISILNQDLGFLQFNKDINLSQNLLKTALSGFETLHIKTHIALVKNKLGLIHQFKGENEKAINYFNDSLNLSYQINNKFAESETRFNLAKIQSINNNYQEALIQSKESVKLSESLYSDVVNSKLKSIYFSNIYDRYELFINLLMKKEYESNDFKIQALQVAEQSRSRSLLETLILTEANFIKDADPILVRKESEIRNLLEKQTNKLVKLIDDESSELEISAIKNKIGILQNQLEEIRGILKQDSPIYSSIKNPAPFDVNEFQNKILDENTILLEFSFGKEESYLWCVEKNNITSYKLPKREILESRIQKLRELLNDRNLKSDSTVEDFQTRLANAENEYWQEAKLLSNQILGQVSDKLGVKRLIIIPDGKLNYFPISALPFPNSNNFEPILLSNEIVYEPSATTLNIILSNQPNKSLLSKDLLMFADPVFAKDDNRLTNISTAELNDNTNIEAIPNLRFAGSLNNLQRLPASAEEAELVTNIVGKSNSDILNGFSATRDRVLADDFNKYKILHFATHGLINEEHPELSSIALSQFNEKGETLNGLIRLQDIYSLNLSSDLVVLSACETGIGKEVKGEGLMSLNNAFLQVGAKSVISSFWKVDDQATKELMKGFYQELASGTTTTSESLRQAQIKLYKNPQYKSPFYWAAFTMQGDYKNIPKLSTNQSNYRVYLIIGIILLICASYYGYRKYYSTAKV